MEDEKLSAITFVLYRKKHYQYHFIWWDPKISSPGGACARYLSTWVYKYPEI